MSQAGLVKSSDTILLVERVKNGDVYVAISIAINFALAITVSHTLLLR